MPTLQPAVSEIQNENKFIKNSQLNWMTLHESMDLVRDIQTTSTELFKDCAFLCENGPVF